MNHPEEDSLEHDLTRLSQSFDLASLKKLIDKSFKENDMVTITEEVLIAYIDTFFKKIESKVLDRSIFNHQIREFYQGLQSLLNRVFLRDNNNFFVYMVSKKTHGQLYKEVSKKLNSAESQKLIKKISSAQTCFSEDSSKLIISYVNPTTSTLSHVISNNINSNNITHLTLSGIKFDDLALFEPSCKHNSKKHHYTECYNHTLLTLTAIKTLKNLIELDLSENQYGHHNRYFNHYSINKKGCSYNLNDEFRKFLKQFSKLKTLILRNNWFCDADFWELMIENLNDKETFVFGGESKLREFDFSVNFLSFAIITDNERNVFPQFRNSNVKIDISANYTYSYDAYKKEFFSYLDKEEIRDIFFTRPLYVESLIDPRIFISPNSWCAVTSYHYSTLHSGNLSETMTEQGELSLTLFELTSDDKKICFSKSAKVQIRARDAMEFAFDRNSEFRFSTNLWRLTSPKEVKEMQERYFSKINDTSGEKLYPLSYGLFSTNCFLHAKKSIFGEKKDIPLTTGDPSNHLHTIAPSYSRRVNFNC